MQHTQPLILRRYEMGLAVGWTLAIVILLTVNVWHEREQTVETARTQARSNFQRDLTYRQWNAANGAVYVEVRKDLQPNPYLAHIRDRDVTTPSGKKLTLVNPAYMSRLVFDLAAQGQEVKGHISSLRPLRSQNGADPWERHALETFAQGATEASSVEEMGGTSFLRLMGPLRTVPECLKCHGKDGYRVGDIRGGISVAVPMAPLWAIAGRTIRLYLLSFLLLWLAGLAGIFAGGRKLREAIRQRDRAAREIEALNRDLLAMTSELKTANHELESFCATVSHDLRSPLSCISGYCQLIEQLPADRHTSECGRYTGIIGQQARRMERLIQTLLDFAHLTRGALNREATDLREIGEEIAAELRFSSLGRQGNVRITADIVAECDAALLRVVLHNLLGNAWKYTAPRECAEIVFGTRAEAGETVYYVADNGIGFDESQKERLFEAFHRLDNADGFEGSGIGLATVKRIVTRHGGRIWCKGALDKGAVFSFTLSRA